VARRFRTRTDCQLARRKKIPPLWRREPAASSRRGHSSLGKEVPPPRNRLATVGPITASEKGASGGSKILRISGLTPYDETRSPEEKQPAAELLPILYAELRRLAAVLTTRLPPGQTLQPTALVHEAYLRLLGDKDPGWEGRRHFFGAAAQAM